MNSESELGTEPHEKGEREDLKGQPSNQDMDAQIIRLLIIGD